MKEFNFRPLNDDNESWEGSDYVEEPGAREGDEEALAAEASSSTSRPRLKSVWNVDGELIHHPAINIK